MSRIVDNMIALRILKMLVTPFTDTAAFHLGIIDAQGKPIRKVASLNTTAEQDAYTYLNRLVFSMKRIINRLPGGESKIKSLVAALWLVKEYYETGNRSTSLMQEKFDNMVKMMDNHVVLCEEEIIVKKFLEEEGEGAPPTNNTSGACVNEPKISKKEADKYKKGNGTTIAGMLRRPTPVTK